MEEKKEGLTETVQPQREHQWLQGFVGQWKFQGSAMMEPGKPATTFEGTESVRSIGGLWIVAEGQGEMPCAGQATTIMTLGYDTQQKRYLGTFIGSMMTHLWLYEGELDNSETVLTLNTVGPDMEGKLVPFRDVIEFKNQEHRVLTSYMQGDDGTWQEIMTANYRRIG